MLSTIKNSLEIHWQDYLIFHIDKPDNLLNFKWTHTILAIPLDRPIFFNDVISMLKEIFTAMYK